MHSPPPLSLLLVEDEAVAREFMAVILARKYPRITLHTADSGLSGLEIFTTLRPDILITDINMPDMGGMQLIGEVSALKPDTRIIVLTGDSGRAALQDAIGKGCTIDHYLVKPVDFDELFAALETCFGMIGR